MSGGNLNLGLGGGVRRCEWGYGHVHRDGVIMWTEASGVAEEVGNGVVSKKKWGRLGWGWWQGQL